jgi:sulfite exporter TauE/SafE/copper chaperone CopZ
MRTVVQIAGMTCKACEVRVGKALRAVPGVRSVVSVSAAKGRAVVVHSVPLDDGQVSAAVRRAGYAVGAAGREWVSRDAVVGRDVVRGGLGIGAVAAVVWATGLGRWVEGLSSGVSGGNLLLVVLLGLAASVSTCMALVGGLVLGVSARFAERHPDAGPARRMRPQLMFNLGRVLGFGVLGALVGALGKVVALSGPALAVAVVAVSVVMGLLGLKLTGVSPRLAGTYIALPAGLSRMLRLDGRKDASWSTPGGVEASGAQGVRSQGGEGRQAGGPLTKDDAEGASQRGRTARAPWSRASGYRDADTLLLGAASFFLPCGFTQAVQVYALSTGDPLQAGLVLALFALGTAPGLMGVGAATAFLRGPRAASLLRVVGVLVLAFAVVNLGGALRTLGLGQPAAPVPAVSTASPNAPVVDGQQQLSTTVGAGGYTPADAVLAADVPTQWTLDVQELGCAGVIYAPELGFDEVIWLNPGENTVELPALAPGTYSYSCAMGMYWGSITAV